MRADGANTVCSTMQLVYVAVDERSLRNSITVTIESLGVDDFLEARLLERFVAAVASLDAAWLPQDVRVFAVEGSTRAVNVSFFVFVDERLVE